MEGAELKTLLNQNLVIVQKLEKKASMFSNGMLVLSLLDVAFGILAIFCTSLQVTALFMSASSLTAISICGRVIQLNKIKQLNKSLKTLNVISLAWFVNKYSKLLKEKKVKMTKSTVLQKILTTVIAIFGVGGVVVGFLPKFAPIAEEISLYCAMASEALAVISGLWLAGTSDKVLSAEEVEAEKKAKEEKAKEKKLEWARAKMAEYEEAKKVLEENK
jgi:type III secretory pathway component EscT